MASIHSTILPLCRLAAATTLSNGTIFIVLDQSRDGTRIVVGYRDCLSQHDGGIKWHCDAIERCLEHCGHTCYLSEMHTVRLQHPLRTLNGMNFAHSRHAMVLYWDAGVWLWTKSGPAIHVDLSYLEQRDRNSDAITS